jgi:hypothetical protein
MEDQTMFTQKNAKTMAKYLRDSLADRKISLSHSVCLEIVARQFGFADWNTLSAKLPAEGGADMTRTVVPWSTCSFCGKSRNEIRFLVGGCGGWEAFRASREPERSNVFICDECATLVAQHFASSLGTPKESPEM